MSPADALWQQWIVGAMVVGAMIYVTWTLTPAPLRLRALQTLSQRSIRAARLLAPLQRRLLAGSGCSACSARKPQAPP